MSEPLSEAPSREQLLEDQSRRWRQGERIPVERYLAEHPSLSADPEAVLDLLYHEIVLRETRGESTDLDDYVRRFPQWAAPLRLHFQVHRVVQAAASAVTPSDLTSRDTAARAPAAADWPAVPGYEILEELGRGGMGVVYQARQLALHRVVALKLLKAGPDADAEQLTRFRAEAEAAARLQHPHVVQIYDVGTVNDRPYFALEYLEGGSLDRKLAGRPQPVRQAAALVATLARAVHAAHERGIIHRDLKPANVLLTADGTPKIADFGLAKRLDVSSGTTLTGVVMGTPGYMAPEQAAGQSHTAGPAADVYALGAILYELLTGRPPFQGENPLETLQQALAREPLPPRSLQPKIPRDLETICLKCLEKPPRKRYAGADALAEDLRRFEAGEPIQARPTPLWEHGLKWARRRPVVAASLLITTAAVACLLAAWIAFTAQLQVARDRADNNATRAERQKDTAEKEWRRAEINYQRALDAVDRMLTRISERKLAAVPQMDKIRKELLEDALQFYQTFLQEKDNPDPSIRHETGLAYYRLAKLKRLLGRPDQALEDIRRAVALQQELADTFPEQPLYRHELAKYYHNLGIYLGQKPEAEQAFRRSLSLKEQLIREDGTVAEYRAGLATSLYSLAMFYRRTDRASKADEIYQQVLEVQERLTQEQPRNLTYRRALANTHNSLGVLYLATNRSGKAEEAFRYAKEIRTQVADADPGNPISVENLWEACNNLGAFYHETGRTEKAEKLYREALALSERLVHDHPGVPTYEFPRAGGYANLARLYLSADQPEKAAEPCKKALELLTPLTRAYPAMPEYQEELAKTSDDRATIYSASGHHERAEETMQEALALWERLVENHPQRLDYAAALAQCYHNMGEIVSKGGAPERALVWYQQALSAAAKVLKFNARHPKAGLVRGAVYCARAKNYLRLGRSAEALQDLDQAVKFYDGPEREQVPVYRSLAKAFLLASQGDPAQAIQQAETLATQPAARKVTAFSYHFARLYAVASAAVRRNAELSAVDRDRIAEQYAANAVKLLGEARTAGEFKDWPTLGQLRKNADFQSLQSRSDFQRLLTDWAKEVQMPAKRATGPLVIPAGDGYRE